MHIAIVGAGTAGARIAQAVALNASQVTLHDADESAMRRALSRVSRALDRDVAGGALDRARARRARRVFSLAETLEDCAGAAIVIEAVSDDLALKQAVFSALDEIVPDSTILGTTSHALSITAIAAGTRRPERVIGLHFARQAHQMRLVEVVRGARTSPDVVDRAQTFLRAIGKTPLIVPDTPGQIVNRVAQAYTGEALHLLDDGGLEMATIDRLMEAAGFPLGPFRLMDDLGVEATLTLGRAIFEATYYAASYRPHPRLERLVEAGRAGGEQASGFYDRPGAAPHAEK